MTRRAEIERLVRLLTALSHDCENTDGWEDAAPDLREACEALSGLIKREEEHSDAFNSRFQDLLYTLIDGKADGLRDCNVTEIINVAVVAFNEAGKDVAGV